MSETNAKYKTERHEGLKEVGMMKSYSRVWGQMKAEPLKIVYFLMREIAKTEKSYMLIVKQNNPLNQVWEKTVNKKFFFRNRRMWKLTRGCCNKRHFWAIKRLKKTRQDCCRKVKKILVNLFTVGDLEQSF